jgi:hypothetical protein
MTISSGPILKALEQSHPVNGMFTSETVNHMLQPYRQEPERDRISEWNGSFKSKATQDENTVRPYLGLAARLRNSRKGAQLCQALRDF